MKKNALCLVSFMKKLTKFCVFFVFFCLVLEISLNFLKPKTLQYYRDTKLIHKYHTEYYIGLEENVNTFIVHYNNLWQGNFKTNSLGYRNLYEVESTQNQIVCVGDSIVMGFGVSDEQTFCHQINHINFQNENLQSINLGVDAYGSLGSYKRLKEASEKLNIKVALFFIAPNDFSLPKALWDKGILPDDIMEAKREKEVSLKKKLQFQITKYSYFLQVVKLAYEQLKVKSNIMKISFRDSFQKLNYIKNWNKSESFINDLKFTFYQFPEKKSQNKEIFCPPLPPKHFQCQKEKIQNLKELPSITKQTYKKMINLSKNKNFLLIPVLLPIQVEDLYCFSNDLHSNFYRYALRAKNFFKKQNITVIDLSKYTKQLCGQKIIQSGKEKILTIEDYFIQGDGHLTAIGNKWVAKSLKLALVKYQKNAL